MNNPSVIKKLLRILKGKAEFFIDKGYLVQATGLDGYTHEFGMLEDLENVVFSVLKKGPEIDLKGYENDVDDYLKLNSDMFYLKRDEVTVIDEQPNYFGGYFIYAPYSDIEVENWINQKLVEWEHGDVGLFRGRMAEVKGIAKERVKFWTLIRSKGSISNDVIERLCNELSFYLIVDEDADTSILTISSVFLDKFSFGEKIRQWLGK